jgi:hypothetical protein
VKIELFVCNVKTLDRFALALVFVMSNGSRSSGTPLRPPASFAVDGFSQLKLKALNVVRSV